MKPIIPWPGGKTRLASTLLPLFPDHHADMVRVFKGLRTTKAAIRYSMGNNRTGSRRRSSELIIRSW